MGDGTPSKVPGITLEVITMKKKVLMIVALAVGLISGSCLMVSATPVTDSKDVTLEITQPESIELIISNNVVDFGDVTGLTEQEKTNALTVSVKSSKDYDVMVKANGDFVSGDKSNSVSDLKVKFDSDEYQTVGKTNSNLKTGEVATYGLDDFKKSYGMSFKLADQIGAASGNYTSVLTLTAQQK